MDNWLNYLSFNPVVSLALVVVLVLFLFMVFRKIIKWALISFVILAVAVGLSYNEAQKPDLFKKLQKQSKGILKDGEKTASKAIERVKKEIEKKNK